MQNTGDQKIWHGIINPSDLSRVALIVENVPRESLGMYLVGPIQRGVEAPANRNVILFISDTAFLNEALIEVFEVRDQFGIKGLQGVQVHQILDPADTCVN